jgi:hypothetical protein
MAALALPAVLACGAIGGCGRANRADLDQPVPTFSATPGHAAAPGRRRDTLLPADCTNVITGSNMSALLGQPVDSVRESAVLGQPSPSVGQLERLTCLYQRAGSRGDPPSVTLNLTAYTSDTAADAQLTTNINAERADATASEELTIGTARAMLFAERGASVLMVASGRSAVTVTLRDGVVRADQARQMMIDLVQRVLPNLAPSSPGTSR